MLRFADLPAKAIGTVVLVILAGCSFQEPSLRVVEWQGQAMGTSYHIKVVLPGDAFNVDTLRAAVSDALETVENQMSTYRPDSELSRLNRSPPGEWQAVSDDLYSVVSFAQSLSVQSHGRYDVTVGPLVNLWGFGPEASKDDLPADEAIKAALARVGYQKLDVRPEALQLRRLEDIYVDLSSVAKGYGVDQAARALESQGITAYLVEVGGEVFARGTKPDGQGWRLAIEKPVSNEFNTIDTIVRIDGVGLATSGDYRNYFEREGVSYSHTLDSTTGFPVQGGPASVTVIAPNCMMADGLATMYMTLGVEKGYQHALENSAAVYFIERSGTSLTRRMTPAFEAFVIQRPEGAAQEEVKQ